MDRPWRRPQNSFVIGLSPGWRRDNRARRLIALDLVRAAGVGILVASTAACSLSFPISGLKVDDTPIGSIDRSAAFLSPRLDGEDMRRAKAAMAVALDPQGNGEAVEWQNPQTGAKGSFTAPAPPFLDRDRICRAFVAEVSSPSWRGRRLASSACRDTDGNWTLRDAGAHSS